MSSWCPKKWKRLEEEVHLPATETFLWSVPGEAGTKRNELLLLLVSEQETSMETVSLMNSCTSCESASVLEWAGARAWLCVREKLALACLSYCNAQSNKVVCCMQIFCKHFFVCCYWYKRLQLASREESRAIRPDRPMKIQSKSFTTCEHELLISYGKSSSWKSIRSDASHELEAVCRRELWLHHMHLKDACMPCGISTLKLYAQNESTKCKISKYLTYETYTSKHFVCCVCVQQVSAPSLPTLLLYWALNIKITHMYVRACKHVCTSMRVYACTQVDKCCTTFFAHICLCVWVVRVNVSKHPWILCATQTHEISSTDMWCSLDACTNAWKERLWKFTA